MFPLFVILQLVLPGVGVVTAWNSTGEVPIIGVLRVDVTSEVGLVSERFGVGATWLSAKEWVEMDVVDMSLKCTLVLERLRQTSSIRATTN
jgi:hypothetical protein